MEKEALIFSRYCKENFNKEIEEFSSNGRYESLPICILDCVYSLRAKYFAITVPVIKRYADKYMAGDIYSSSDTLAEFISRIKEYEDCSIFAHDILRNKF